MNISFNMVVRILDFGINEMTLAMLIHYLHIEVFILGGYQKLFGKNTQSKIFTVWQ